MLAQNARFGRLVQRLFGTKGDIALDVQPAAVPVVPLVSADDVSMFAPRGDQPWHVGANSPAIAGQFSFVKLANAPGSGRLVIVDLMFLCHGGASFVSWNLIQEPAAVPTAMTPRDARLSDAARSACGLLTGASAGAILPTASPRVNGLAGNNTVVRPGVVLLPGWALAIQEVTTVNQKLEAGILWRERVLTPEETSVPPG